LARPGSIGGSPHPPLPYSERPFPVAVLHPEPGTC
jgi:hypothetical protein